MTLFGLEQMCITFEFLNFLLVLFELKFDCDDVLQVSKMRIEYAKLDKAEMSIWECCELLNDVVDDSDPDLDEPQIQHLLQSAEAIRKDYPNEDWLHLTALIHGTILFNSLFCCINVSVSCAEGVSEATCLPW